MAPDAQAFTSGATGGSKRADFTVPSAPSARWTVVLTTTVTLSARGRPARHDRTAAATATPASTSVRGALRDGATLAACPSGRTAPDSRASAGSDLGTGATAGGGDSLRDAMA